ncbi:amino acid permease [Sphingosinicella sp.]|uniref:APC family permease n=1 Tax=Sphingosinicella sp. TaxID=1917971 RepID=UPI0017F5114D|nr:amino acid permease [Sphingosinicella sp.]MBA4757712.1 amino acid permease [Sphingosinicella sp.]
MTASAKPQMIGFWMTAALVVGTIIGSGIFMLPISLAPLGPNALIGWVISGVGILCIAYGLARLSRLGGDGIQANVEKEYGSTVAFLVAWSFWVSNWVAQAAVALAAAAALSFVSPSLGGDAAIVPMAIGWLIVLTAINAVGVRAAGSFSIITVAIKLIPLLAVVFLFVERGVTGGTFEPFAPVAVNFANIATATALTFFAFTGFETVTTPVGKVRDPERTIPRALIGGTAFVVLLYLIAGTAIQMLLPTSAIVASPAPFADALVSRWGNTAATVSALTVAVAAIGCLNGLILGSGELGYAMALRGEMPKAMTKTRGSNTPVAAQIAATILSVILLLANSSRATAHLFTFIILLSTAAMVLVYLTSALAAWRCSPAPAQRLLIAGAILFIAFATYGIGLEASLWCLVLLAIGLVVRGVMFRLNRISAAATMR